MNYPEEGIMAEAIAHGIEDYPKEACGLIIAKGKKQALRRCENIGEAGDFFMKPADTMAAEDEGEWLMSYHTHPNQPPTPSFADKYNAEKNHLPGLIINIRTNDEGKVVAGDHELYTPNGWRAELIGRPYVEGVLDCYSLIQDYYREKLKIELPDVAREPGWWKTGKDLYVSNYKKGGFVQVGGLQEHDIILMYVAGSQVLNHGAIWLGDGRILHHPADRLSCRQPYVIDRGYYAKHTGMILRHRSLLVNITA